MEYNNLEIYESIQNLKDYIEENTSTTITGSRKLGRIDIEDVEKLINDIELSISNDVREAKSIIDDRDRILSDARSEADNIVKTANTKAEAIWKSAEDGARELMSQAKNEQSKIISDHEITKKAQLNAQSMVKKTVDHCNKMYASSQEDAHQMLDELQHTVHSCTSKLSETRNNMLDRLQSTMNDIAKQLEQLCRDCDASTDRILEATKEVDAQVTAQRDWIDGREPRTRQDYEDDINPSANREEVELKDAPAYEQPEEVKAQPVNRSSYRDVQEENVQSENTKPAGKKNIFKSFIDVFIDKDEDSEFEDMEDNDM